MDLFVGTSGYSYKEWRGTFYPADLKPAAMLPYYAERFSTVEINATFYRMPKPDVLASWVSQVPAEFRFAVKANRRLTHLKRLRAVEAETAFLLETLGALGPSLGVLLVQLPPNLKLDLERLSAFLALLPDGLRVAFEFRHESWLDEQVFAALRARDHALVAADVDEGLVVPLIHTASWAYLRLRKAEYEDAELSAWHERLGAAGRSAAYVYFKHEDEGRGPAFAARFLALAP